MRKRLDDLRAKADEAERRYDLATASDLRYFAIPELQTRIEKAQAEEAASGGTLEDSVTPEAIAEVVARWTSIPVTRLLSTEKEKLLKLEKTLSDSVVGQPEAVKAVANAIRLSRSGLRNENRPLASFLFCGPSGTGKTLLSKTVSLLFNATFESSLTPLHSWPKRYLTHQTPCVVSMGVNTLRSTLSPD
jgi:ATP-dependent Clp protease ATP-binding subunit ClpB